MFTVMFAIGRLPVGLQWKEMRENKEPIGDQGKYILDLL
jgi:citrate synthase